jgi:hypothetical protein
MKPTRLVAGKFSLRCYLPLLLLHISSKETRSVQSWLHTPEKNKTRGARSRREDEEKGNQGRKIGVQVPDSLTVRASLGLLCTSAKGRKVHEKKSQKASALS